MATHSSNSYLSLSQMQDNAMYIYSYFKGLGWSNNSICAMLGNMQRESTINPGLWQNMDEGNTSLGLGLVQWTPATNLINWCEDRGYDYLSIGSQCMRIIYELENGLQYYATDNYPETFKEFTKSTKSLSYLTTAFLKNYERAGVEALDERIENAEYWYDYLVLAGGGGDIPDTPDEPDIPDTPVNLYKKKKHYKFHLFKKRRIL